MIGRWPNTPEDVKTRETQIHKYATHTTLTTGTHKQSNIQLLSTPVRTPIIAGTAGAESNQSPVVKITTKVEQRFHLKQRLGSKTITNTNLGHGSIDSRVNRLTFSLSPFVANPSVAKVSN